jgi:phosphate/sulfate permease
MTVGSIAGVPLLNRPSPATDDAALLFPSVVLARLREMYSRWIFAIPNAALLAAV